MMKLSYRIRQMLRREFLLAALAGSVLTGCGRHERKPRQEQRPMAFEQQADDLVAIVVLDLSGSFTDQLFGKDAKAYRCLQQILNAMHQERIGTRDRLILAQISSSDRPILWEGTMSDFGASFPSESAFRSFMLARAKNQSSRVYDSISDTLEHAMRSHNVNKGKTNVACFVLSDMDDNVHTSQSYPRLVQQLSTLADHRGVIGLYFVDQRYLAHWCSQLRTCGFPADRCFVGADFASNTPIPNFKK